jgi:hypothetical protein
MKIRKFVSGLALVSGFAIMPIATHAQNGTTPQQDVDKSADVRTLTGCLVHGEKTSEYELKLDDGSMWDIKSDKFKLSSHLGHTITVTGNVSHPQLHGAKERTKEAIDPNSTEHGTLTLTDLSTVSRNCKK